MLFAVLEYTDFAFIAILVSVLSGGVAVTASYFRPSDRARQQRIEKKLDMLLSHHALEYTPPDKSSWEELASDPGKKIAAIKAYRDRHGVSLPEAKQAIEEYVDQGSHRT